jgi:UrcA family protein
MHSALLQNGCATSLLGETDLPLYLESTSALTTLHQGVSAMKTSSIIAPFLLSVLVAAPVIAQSGPETVSRSVRYADLDLGSAAGQKALRLRVQHVVAELCGLPSSSDPQGRREIRRCRAEATQVALAEAARAYASASRPTVVALGE